MLRSVLAALILLAALPDTTRADMIFGPQYECPTGSAETFSHAGAWCETKSCADACRRDDACRCAGGTCRPWRLCTAEITYQTRGDNFDSVEHTGRAVVNSCAPEEGCTGWAVPRPRGPTVVDDSVQCEVLDACVGGRIPSFLDQMIGGPDEPDDEPETRTDGQAQGCACRSDGNPGSAAFVALALAVIARRRPRRG